MGIPLTPAAALVPRTTMSSSASNYNPIASSSPSSSSPSSLSGSNTASASSAPPSSQPYSSAPASASPIPIALTTIFPAPPSCTENTFIYTSADGTASSNYWLYSSASNVPTITAIKSAETCYPPNFYLAANTKPLYTPGACPRSWTMAYASVNTTDGVTQATCCPEGATSVSSQYWCNFPPVSSAISISNGATSVYKTPILLEMVAVTVAWHSSELNFFQPASAPLHQYQLAFGTGDAASSSATSTSSANSPSSSDKSDGLSTGAKAGIGVGVAIGALLIIGLLVWALLERRKRTKRTAAEAQHQQSQQQQHQYQQAPSREPQMSYYSQGGHSYGGGQSYENAQSHYASAPGSPPPQEAYGKSVPYEMNAENARHELPHWKDGNEPSYR